MKSRILTAMLIVAAFAVGLMMNNSQQQEAQASVDLSTLYAQLDTMQAKLDNLSVTCQRECEVSEYSLPDFKVTEFVTLTEVVTVTQVVTVTDYVTEVVYADRIITDTVYIDVPTCDKPEGDTESESDKPQVEQPEDESDDIPGPVVEEPAEDESESDAPEEEKKSKCNQGVGNGDENCDPGNSNHNQPSNDEATSDGKVPGSPGRSHNDNGNSDDKSSSKSEDKGKGKSEEVKVAKEDKKSKNG